MILKCLTFNWLKWSRLQNQIGGKKDGLSRTEVLHVFMFLLTSAQTPTQKKSLHGILESDYIHTSSSFTTWVWQACHVYRTSTRGNGEGVRKQRLANGYTSVTSFIVKRTTRNDKSRGVSGRPRHASLQPLHYTPSHTNTRRMYYSC